MKLARDRRADAGSAQAAAAGGESVCKSIRFSFSILDYAFMNGTYMSLSKLMKKFIMDIKILNIPKKDAEEVCFSGWQREVFWDTQVNSIFMLRLRSLPQHASF